jgi:hypothetical protein
MPASQFSTILHKRNSVPGAIPSLSTLSAGEIAVNDYDGKLFVRTINDTVENFLNENQIPYKLDAGLSAVNFQYGNNIVSQVLSNILGGYGNDIAGAASTITNGELNSLSADFSFIGSGAQNTITPAGDFSAILGGHHNLVSHANSFVLGSNLSSHAENFTYVNNISGTVAAFSSLSADKLYGDGSSLTGTIDTTKLPLAGGTLTGKLFGNDANFSNSVKSATISAVEFVGDGSLLTGVAKIDSPAFIGTPTASTAPANTSSTQLATTQFVMQNRGDKYLTSSTTTLALANNQTYSLTAGSGLSYTAPQPITLAYNSSNYMDANVVSYDINTGAMVINNTARTGTGTYSLWTVNVQSIPVAGGLLAANNLSDVISPSAALLNLGGFPNTGGTVNGSITANGCAFNSVTFTSNFVDLPYQTGKVWYDSKKDALCYYNSVSGNTVHVGQEIQQYVRNASANTILKGDVVRIVGFTDQSPDVVLAQATSLSGSIITGVANQDIPSNTNGYVVTIGEIANLDTSRFTAGQDLFLSPLSAGKITNILPLNPYFAVQVGVCMYSHETNGKLLVYTQYLGAAADTIIGTLGIDQLATSVGSTVSIVSSLSSKWESVYTTVNSISSTQYLRLSGGTLTGGVAGTTAAFNSVSAISFYGDGSALTGLTIGSYLSSGGGTLTGSLTGTTAAFNSISAVTFYGDGSALTGLTIGSYLSSGGGTLTGGLTGSTATFNSISATRVAGDGSMLTGITLGQLGTVSAGTTLNQFVGDGTTQTYLIDGFNSLDKGSYIVSVGGIDQPGTFWDVSATNGGQITFDEAPKNGEVISVRVLKGIVVGATGVPAVFSSISADVFLGDGSGLTNIFAPYLPLSGGVMNGAIRFGESYGPRIEQGRYDTSRGGLSGISLVCSVDYDFNWQAGWLTVLQQDRLTPLPLHIDSGAGTSVKIWNGEYIGSGGSGVEISHTGITFPDNTVQTTAALGGSLSSYVTLSTTQTLTNKTVVDWMTLVRGYNATPTLLANIGSGEVYTYVYNSSPTNITYYRFISNDGSTDAFYNSWNGSAVSGLVASKSITL